MRGTRLHLYGSAILILLPCFGFAGEGLMPSQGRVCINLSPRNLVPFESVRKWFGISQGFQMVPHVFFSAESLEGNGPRTALGFYPNEGASRIWASGRTLRSEQLTQAEQQNGGGQNCVNVDLQRLQGCLDWLKHQQKKIAGGDPAGGTPAKATQATQAPPQLKTAPKNAPLPTVSQDYSLLSNNCATFAAEGWKACTGREIPNIHALGFIPHPERVFRHAK